MIFCLVAAASASSAVWAQTVDLATDMTDAPDPILASGLLSYTVTWTNQGSATASEAVAEVVLPAEASFWSLLLSGSTGPLEGCAYSASTHRVGCTFFGFDVSRTLQLQLTVVPQPEPTATPGLESTYDMLAAAVIDSIVELDGNETNDLDTELTEVFTCEAANVCAPAVLEDDGTGTFQCAFVPLTGIPCEAPCFEPGVCIEGACELGPPVTCPSSEEACREGVCNPATGACEMQDVPDSTPCTTGDACLIDESCAAGVCQGGTVAPGCGPSVPLVGLPLLPLALLVVGASLVRQRRVAGPTR